MIKISLAKKILIIFSGIFLCSIFTANYFFYSFSKKSYDSEMKLRGFELSNTISDHIVQIYDGDNIGEIIKLLQIYEKSQHIFAIFLYDNSGDVSLESSGVSLTNIEREFFPSNENQWTRNYYLKSGEAVADFTAKVFSDSAENQFGHVRVLIDRGPLIAALKKLLTNLIFVNLFIFAMAFLVFIFTTKKALRPVPLLISAMKRASAEQFNAPVPILGHDELGELSAGFNHMIGELQRAGTKSRLAAILEGTNDFVGFVNSQYNFSFINSAGKRMLGIEKDEEVYEIHLSKFFEANEKNPNNLNDTLASLDATGKWQGGATLVINHDARILDISMQMEKDHQSNEKVISFIARDITNQEKLEQQLRQSQKMDAIGRLAGGVAHDFNNLLTIILSGAELVGQDLTQNEKINHNVTLITDAALKGASLTKQLLAFSRQQVLEPQIHCLNHLVKAVSSMIKRLIGEQIELSVLLKEQELYTKADKGQIEQVILNLCINARDAMHGKGRLEIKTSLISIDEKSAINQVSLAYGKYVWLSISDNGDGMEQKTQDKIFEPFFTTKPVGQGTGLGLSTVFGIVKQSGGTIRVSSELNVGTTFQIFLPQQNKPKINIDDLAKNSTLKIAPKNILLVEDEINLRSISAMVLKNSGHVVSEASDGEEGIEILSDKGSEIEVVITDAVMPKLGGVELIDHVKIKCPNIKTILMSGYSREIFSHKEKPANVDAYIQKPYLPKDLLRALARVTEK